MEQKYVGPTKQEIENARKAYLPGNYLVTNLRKHMEHLPHLDKEEMVMRVKSNEPHLLEKVVLKSLKVQGKMSEGTEVGDEEFQSYKRKKIAEAAWPSDQNAL